MSNNKKYEGYFRDTAIVLKIVNLKTYKELIGKKLSEIKNQRL